MEMVAASHRFWRWFKQCSQRKKWVLLVFTLFLLLFRACEIWRRNTARSGWNCGCGAR